jgi:hypothetical protein
MCTRNLLRHLLHFVILGFLDRAYHVGLIRSKKARQQPSWSGLSQHGTPCLKSPGLQNEEDAARGYVYSELNPLQEGKTAATTFSHVSMSTFAMKITKLEQ